MKQPHVKSTGENKIYAAGTLWDLKAIRASIRKGVQGRGEGDPLWHYAVQVERMAEAMEDLAAQLKALGHNPVWHSSKDTKAGES